ncbi:MAG: hypothetical protein COA30_03235 [Sulfurimonas sp.]|nr:MAG: hypothetical protein COA30_03235 [Sulfurimonas sp.]
MQLREALIAWDPDNGTIEVGEWPDKKGWSKKYFYTGGACYTAVRKMSNIEAMHCVHRDAITLIIRDKMNPFQVHEEFLKINEYAQSLSSDTPGAKA